MRPNTIEGLLARGIRDVNGCLRWPGAHYQNGYGAVHYQNRQQRIHRVMWVAVNGPLDVGDLVCHHCDVRDCYEITHLFKGSQQDNISDMIQKGRGPDHSQRPAVSAETRERMRRSAALRDNSRVGRHKPTAEQRERIRAAALRRDNTNVGKWERTPEVRAKLREVMSRRTMSDEARKKISDAQRGTKRSDETRRKMSESAKRLWAARRAAQT